MTDATIKTHRLLVKILPDCPNKEFVTKYYTEIVNNINYQGDSGVNIIFPLNQKLSINKVAKVNLGVACEMIPHTEGLSKGFRLVPRSSMSNTPLSLANSEGIFDAAYRGPVIAALRCHVDADCETTMTEGYFEVKSGTSVVQIVHADMLPIKIEVVNELSSTERGANGFGSTTKK